MEMTVNGKTKAALESAQNAVSNINRKQLMEIAALRNPPKLIEKTIQAIAILMGIKVKDWKGFTKLLSSMILFHQSKI